ncbi:MAG: radical SAM protein [Clostridia bacterium]|nr:radical SAM protein [Clostridia bacterium]
MKCNLCPNKCNIDRSTQLGACLCGQDMVINRIAPHYYEEPPISGNNGSGTVFFGGCVMKCDFCQNAVISRAPKGKKYTPRELADEIKRLEDKGVHNINFVTPTQWSDQIKRTLDIYRPNVPIVYNTSGYEDLDVLKGLMPYVDIFLPDYKYSDCTLAKRLSKRGDYPSVALDAIELMVKEKPTIYNGDMLKQGVIIRHLILPGYLDNSKHALDLLVERIGTDLTISLMSQFTPMPNCTDPNRRLKPIEYKMIINHALKLGLTNIFTQEISSAEEEYIPDFDTKE